MQLPEDLHFREFSDWNLLVKGLIEAWTLAAQLGLEERLESQLANDDDGVVTELVARIGNDCAHLAELVSTRASSGVREAQPAILFAVNLPHKRGDGRNTSCREMVPIGPPRELPPLSIRRFQLGRTECAASAEG